MQHVHGYEISMSSVGRHSQKKKSVGVGQCSYLLIPIWEICEAPHIPRGGTTVGQGGPLPPPPPKKKKKKLVCIYIYIYVEILNFGLNRRYIEGCLRSYPA